ncbi:MAG: hypothetical protein LBB79_08095 [Prevotellaceae bacterium]|nr:hypothetical protein [Prevotellaceae bacterium]
MSEPEAKAHGIIAQGQGLPRPRAANGVPKSGGKLRSSEPQQANRLRHFAGKYCGHDALPRYDFRRYVSP